MATNANVSGITVTNGTSTVSNTITIGSAGCTTHIRGAVYFDEAPSFSGLNEATNLLIENIKNIDSEKLKCLDLVFKKNIKRFNAVDHAYNVAREMGIHSSVLWAQEAAWSVVKDKVGFKEYNIRDGLWDAIIATAVKASITENDFDIMYRPYFLMTLSGS